MLVVICVAIALVVGFIALSANSLTKAKNRIELAEVELKKYEEAGDPKDIDNAKKYHAAVIRDYNNLVESFPTSFVAELFNFPKMHTEDFDEGL